MNFESVMPPCLLTGGQDSTRIILLERFEEGGTFGQIKGLVIASDFGYSGDFGSSLVFAINDIPSQRALTYQDIDG